MSTVKLKECYEAETTYGPFFTGGRVIWDTITQTLLCQNHDKVQILDINTGKVTQTLGRESSDFTEEEQEDAITTFTSSDDFEIIVTAHKSSLIKLWSRKENGLVKVWRSVHKGPIASLKINGNQLASGGSDGSVRLWDLKFQACTHHLQGCQGVVSVIKYHLDLIFASGDDYAIRSWNVQTGQLQMTLTGHFSKITEMRVHENYLITSGRDKVIIVWNLNDQSKRIVPVFESIETFIIVKSKPNKIKALTGGDSGVLKLWDLHKSKLIDTITESKSELTVTQMEQNDDKSEYLTVTTDHNLLVYNSKTHACIKQFVGFSDEILDVTFVGNDSKLAVCSNSKDFKIYDVDTMSCKLVNGHTDLVLTVGSCPADPYLIVTGGKDNAVRLWRYCEQSDDVVCVGVGNRHTASVGSVAFSQLDNSFFVSGSQDLCVKIWRTPQETVDVKQPVILECVETKAAHDKDINSVDISPNDQLIATGSQDKTAKLWTYPQLNLIGVFRGHKRSVWCVKFSTVDQVLLTTSADCTIKLWSITDLNCLKTLEGHDSSVLQARFLTNSTQILSSGADGLIKLWTIKSGECIQTLDAHNGRVWALAVAKSEDVVFSGAADSLLIKWNNVTTIKQEEVAVARQKNASDEQKLANLIQSKRLTEALVLAIELNRPMKTLKILEKIIGMHNDELNVAVWGLSAETKDELAKMVVAWNSNSKFSHVSQTVLHALIANWQAGEYKPKNLPELVEKLLPFTERHFVRVEKLRQDLCLLDFVINLHQA